MNIPYLRTLKLQHDIQFISLLHYHIAKFYTTVCFVRGNSLKYTLLYEAKNKKFLKTN